VTTVPSGLARTAVELHGDRGSVWLRNLQRTLEEFSQHWSLSLMPPFESLTYSYVAPARLADGSDVVLKAGVPNAELTAEIEALKIFGGRGAVQLLAADAGRGVLLLERLSPGTQLSRLPDEEATSEAVRVMRLLWRPVPAANGFPAVADWAWGLGRLRRRFGGTGPLPRSLVERAERLFEGLLSSMGEPVLLHGDLHHMNILAARRRPWLAIDPKGVVGEPAYEVGALLRNPMPDILRRPRLGNVLRRRVDQLTEETGFDRDRILGWGVAQAVLAGWWSLEDHGHGWEPWISCAEALAELM
jgi:streptomycin 6-kinase